MNVAILGFEREGRTALEYYQAQGADVTICDMDPNKEIPAGVPSQLGPDYLKDLDRFDVLMRTPFLKPRDILAANPGVADKVTTGVNEFLRVSPTRNIIGITGTKGKGTTSTLTTKMLEAAGKRVFLAGNIGIPPLELLKQNPQPDDWVVLELSSFQLMDVRHSPHIGVCLMIAPEHLDWHADMKEYMTSKSHLFTHQTADDTAIYYALNDDSKWVASAGEGRKLPYFAPPGASIDNGAIYIEGQEICRTDELKLLGEHNWQNACAAVTAAWQVTQDAAAMRQVLTSFTGLPHRLELVREVNGLRYYNDSFASAPDAAMAAMSAIPGNKVMIIGGFDRQLPLEHLAQALKDVGSGLTKAMFIGASAERLAETCKSAGFENFVVSTASNMKEIVDEASSYAKPGDAVVLSPGFPSFDMFKNFEVRGDQFKQEVLAL